MGINAGSTTALPRGIVAVGELAGGAQGNYSVALGRATQSFGVHSVALGGANSAFPVKAHGQFSIGIAAAMA